jgi:hypothetical protein
VLRRSQAMTHSEMMRAELGEGFEHLRNAAEHAAGGVGATVGPRLDSARKRVGPGTDRVRDAASQGWDTTLAALTPLVEAARTGAVEAGRQTTRARKKMSRKKTSRMSGKRTGLLVGLLTVGAAAGAAGVIIARRRSRSQWEEYDAGSAGMANGQAQSVLDSTRSAMDMAAGKASGGAAEASDKVPDNAAASSKNGRG